MAPRNGIPQEDAPRRYLVEFTEPALADADGVYLWLSQQTGPEHAVRWYEGLFEAAQTLSSLPRIHAIAPENDLYDVEVRRLLYYGPSKRRGNNPYRVLFYTVEPLADEAEGVVRVLHIWHGAKGPPV